MQDHTPQNWLELLKIILDEDRLRVLGVLALQPGSARDVASQLSMKEPHAARHIASLWEAGLLKLVDAGLMHRESGIYHRSAIAPPAPETPSGAVSEGASDGADSGMGQHEE